MYLRLNFLGEVEFYFYFTVLYCLEKIKQNKHKNAEEEKKKKRKTSS